VRPHLRRPVKARLSPRQMQAQVARKRWMPLLVVVKRSEREERGQREERGGKRRRAVISCTVRRVVIAFRIKHMACLANIFQMTKGRRAAAL
jgi:hypothetical protein